MTGSKGPNGPYVRGYIRRRFDREETVRAHFRPWKHVCSERCSCPKQEFLALECIASQTDTPTTDN